MGEQKKPLQSAQQQPGHAETFNAAIFNNYNNNIMKNNNSGNLNHRCSFCQSASCVSEQDMQTIRERLVGGLGYGVEEVSMALEKQYPSSVYCAFHILLKQQTSINVDWLSKLGLMDESLLGKIISGFPSASSSSTTALTTTTTIEVPRSSVTIKQQGSGGSSSNYAAAAALITGVGGWAQPGKARSSITTTMTASAMVVIPSNTTTTSSSSSGNSCDMEMNDVDDDIDEDYVEQQWQRKRQSSNRSNLQHMIVEGEEESDCDEMSSSIDALSLSSRSIGGSVGSIAYRKSLASRRKNLELIANSLLKKM